MPKSRMAFLQGGEGDEHMAPQVISACNQKQRTLKCNEQYDKFGCDLLEMWTVITRIWRGLQSHPNFQIYVGNSAHRSRSKSNMSPTWNPGAVHLKTDAQVT
jgi:hypothetical protein